MNARERLKRLRDHLVDATGFNSKKRVQDVLKEEFQLFGCSRKISKSESFAKIGYDKLKQRETELGILKLAKDLYDKGYFQIREREDDNFHEVIIELNVLKPLD